MNIKPIPLDSPHFPLPADYDTITTLEGQRLARVNACRQWLIKGPERTQRYVGCLHFFDQYYLWPDEATDFNPVFYDDEPCLSPDFHWEIAKLWISWRMTMCMAPRGGAKSFMNLKDMLLRCTTRPAYSFVYATSTHPNARDKGEALKRQWLFNERLNDDFRPEFPGNQIIPKRGEGTFSTEHMVLTNGSWIRLLSASSRQRGARPRRYRLDDPEYDPKSSTSLSQLREYVQELLFKIVIPMVTRPDTGVDWIGTYVSKRHYLWHAMRTEETPDGPRSRDPRFNRWAKLEIPAAIERDGVMHSCWPRMWPATIKQRLELAKDDPHYIEAVSLEEIRMDIGPASFNSEYLGRPGDTDDICFPFDPTPHGPQAYWFSDVDQHAASNPLKSKSTIHWIEQKGEDQTKESMLLSDFLSQHCRIFITADTSYTSTKDSDYKVACCMAITPNNDLFILDLWAKQCSEDKLVKALFTMADAWKCPTIHPEVVSRQISLYHALSSLVNTRATDMMGSEHLPGIKAIKIGMMDKTSKIHSLLFRFEHNKIKFPMWRREVLPWRFLFDQIEEFNPDVDDGGLEKDDCIDCVSMSQFVLKGRLHRAGSVEKEDRTLKEHLIAGSLDDAHGVDIRDLSVVDIEEIIDDRLARIGSDPPRSKV